MRSVSVSTLILALGAAGCSIVFDPGAHRGAGMDGGVTGVDGGASTIELADLCPMFVEAYCMNAERCCREAVTPPPNFDRATCMSDTMAACSGLYGLTATRSEIGYDPAAAYASYQEGLALVEACSVDIQSYYVSRDGFFGGIEGTIAGGLDCTPASETNETDIVVALLSCTGNQVCQRFAADDWRCSAPGGDSATCNSAFNCESGRCEQENILAPRLCGPGEPAMSPCVRSDECESLTCARVPMTIRFECAPSTQANVYCAFATD